MDLTQHIIEHEILGINSTGGGAINPINYWGYQKLDTINSTNITLTQNDNAEVPITDISNIINSTAVITNDKGKPVYTGNILLLSNKVKVTAHTGSNVTLSAIPSANYAPFKIWFLLRGAPPDGYVEAPKFVNQQHMEFLEAAYLNQYGDTLFGDLDVNNHRLLHIPTPIDDTDPARKIDVDSKAPLKDYPLRWYIDDFVAGAVIDNPPSSNGFTTPGVKVAVNDWGHAYNGNIYEVTPSDTWELKEEAYKGLGVLYRPSLIDYYYAGDTDNSWWNDNLINKQDKVASATENNIATWDDDGNTKDSGKAFDELLVSNDVNRVPTSAAVYTAIDNHASNTNNPHNVTLEQARSQDNQIDGDIDFNGNRAINLPRPNSNSEPLIYGNDGELYFYDTSRSKQLGVSTLALRYARNSNSITSNQYLRMINGTATNNNSDVLPWNMTLVAAAISHQNTGNAWTMQVRKNRSTTNIYTLSIDTSVEKVWVDDINIDFNAGDLIQVRLKYDSGTVRYPTVLLIFRRRP